MNVEWNTPDQYLESARHVMGNFDVDPASNLVAQARVRAGCYYTKDRPGLDQPWFGTVWMNPPFKQPLLRRFIDKFVQDYEAGRLKEGIILLNDGSAATQYMVRLFTITSAICLTSKRINFLNEDGQPDSRPNKGQIFCYVGNNRRGFQTHFNHHGKVFFTAD